MATIFIEASRKAEVFAALKRIPGILAGTESDPAGIRDAMRTRITFAFFSLVKEAFIVKARGGTDEAGIKWPTLSEKYLAYQRPMNGRQPPKAGKLAPGGNDGFMTKKQLAKWRKDFSGAVKWLALQLPLKEAKGRAAAIAWSKAKESGVKTKLAVFGQRDVEILRDRGILFNSLSPGQVSGDAYEPADDQIFENTQDKLIVGTNVEYAFYHQVSPGLRPFWPQDGNLPQSWTEEIVEVAVSGIEVIGELIKKGAI